MQTVEQLIDKLKELPEFVKDVCENSIEDNNQDIVDLNREQLRVRGIDMEGDKLGEYTPYSKKLREEKGLQTDFIDLRDTGDFQDSIKLKKKDRLKYEFEATDPKWEDILQPRWPDALGLTPDNEEDLTILVTSILEKQVDNYL